MSSDTSTQQFRTAKCESTRHRPPTSPHLSSFPSDTVATASDESRLQLRVADLENQVRSLVGVVNAQNEFYSSRAAEVEAKVRRLELVNFCSQRELHPDGHFVLTAPPPPPNQPDGDQQWELHPGGHFVLTAPAPPPNQPDGDLGIGHRVVLATPAPPSVQPPVVLAQHLEPAPETPRDSEAARAGEQSVQARRRATHRAYVECLEQLVATQADRDTSAPAAAPSLQARRQATHRAYVADYYASRRY